MILAFLFAMSIGHDWQPALQWSLGLVTLTAIVFLTRLPQENVPSGSFRCPGMPLTPCLGILGNFMLASFIEPETWMYFMAYEALGLIFYVTYGLKHSKLNKLFRDLERDRSINT